MPAKSAKRVLPRSAFRRGDGIRLALATTGLLGALVLAAFTASHVYRAFEASSAAKAVITAQTERDLLEQTRLAAQTRRIGSIVLAEDARDCEELRFDNFTGAFLSMREVDCDERLTASDATARTKPKSGTGMRGMLDSFKK